MVQIKSQVKYVMRALLVLLGAVTLAALAAPARFACADPPNFDGGWQYGFVEPTVPIADNEVRFAVCLTNMDEIVQAACAYRGGGAAGVRFTRMRHGSIKQFDLGQANVLPMLHHMAWQEMLRQGKTWSKPPEEFVLGYWTMAVFVNPANPIAAVTEEQLFRALMNPDSTWKDLGQASNKTIVLCEVDNLFAVARRKPGSGPRDPLHAVAEDPNAMGIWYYSQKNIATGLKVVPILDDDEQPHLPTDAAAVCSGRYPLRIAARYLVHPAANQVTKEFARWLLTPEAGRAIKEARRKETCWPMPTMPAFFHVTESHSADKAPEKAAPVVVMTPPAVKFDAKVEGAVVVLPTQRLSTYYLMAGRAHQAFYEQFLNESLAADGRLKPVDRAQLAKLLEERTLQLAQSPLATRSPLITVDVFVFSWITSEGGQASIQVQAVHGPTASLLGELKFPINAGDPLRFTPPLSESIAQWWPGVLRHLVDVRAKPVWRLADVYAGQADFEKTAEEVRRALDDTLAADPRVFRAVPVPLGATQQEVLLWRMGLSQSRGGRFSPVSDYVVDAHLTAADRIELRLRRGDMSVAQQTELKNHDPARLAAAASEWLAAQVAEQASQRKPTPREGTPADDEWSRKQARVEYARACQLRDKALALNPRCFDVNAMESWHWMVLDDNEARQLLVEARRHNRRAAQLDPTWEAVAHAALEPYFLHQRLVGGDNRLSSPESRIDDFERFLATFPESTHHQEVLAWCFLECLMIGNPRQDNCPLVPIDREMRVEYFRKALRHYRDYLLRYALHGKGGYYAKGADFIDSWRYFNDLLDYLVFFKPPDEELQAIVEQWSKDFDTKPDKLPHSDFVRLKILHAKQDKVGYLKLLAKLQKQWPDPKQIEWQTGGLDSVLASWQYLFPMTYDKDALRQWAKGERGPGGLPDPSDNRAGDFQ
ncbi:MAG: hypothetical protein WCJ35_11925 [Planctomycetota bacterium]